MSRTSSGALDSESKNAWCVATAFTLSRTTRAISAADFFDRFGVWIMSVLAMRCSRALRNSSRLTDQFSNEAWCVRTGQEN